MCVSVCVCRREKVPAFHFVGRDSSLWWDIKTPRLISYTSRTEQATISGAPLSIVITVVSLPPFCCLPAVRGSGNIVYLFGEVGGGYSSREDITDRDLVWTGHRPGRCWYLFASLVEAVQPLLQLAAVVLRGLDVLLGLLHQRVHLHRHCAAR